MLSLESDQQLKQELEKLAQVTADWHTITLQRSNRTTTVDELTLWLDTNCTDTYYCNTLAITSDRVEVRFRGATDAAFFRMTWEQWE